MKEQVIKNIRRFRLEKQISLKQLGEMIGKSETTVGAYEKGSTEMSLPVLISIAEALEVQIHELFYGRQPKKEECMELNIYIKEDRLRVATILLDNGYKVSQGKRKRTPTGKSVDYFLRVQTTEDNVNTSQQIRGGEDGR